MTMDWRVGVLIVIAVVAVILLVAVPRGGLDGRGGANDDCAHGRGAPAKVACPNP